MQCPYCGSTNLIWDEKNGCIVCRDCATIIDSLYDFDQYNTTEIVIDFNKLNIRKSTINFLSLLDNINNKNKYKIDINNKNKYITEDGIYALQLLKMNKTAEEIFNKLTETGYFSGKKIKTRVAISFYLSGYRGNKMRDILKKLHINERYFKKITYKIPNYLKFQKFAINNDSI
ncbi:hypothetical protein DFR86_06505 [Acidianus sulfidivorans JP7]|uniref:TFIIB-type domain-containing protein n=1 Tax=Acidianus sulfidivorans JP7 TaxID=619593 RepID=A0A2U9IMJ6_9CREN|nr:TFIIB-type zinc ribbon-containing protein [Acidianus sulfidivorans]AWR97242.1 hypothetical protein DFR86_06505 [Acidianus sulfidivorans JP7]